ncbi:hypothetical protein HK104_002328 [Borealophlyctis nickersoniae]|nr:hypothetical protein HK104_002328 [Borealophlyctis nickersoniae]
MAVECLEAYWFGFSNGMFLVCSTLGLLYFGLRLRQAQTLYLKMLFVNMVLYVIAAVMVISLPQYDTGCQGVIVVSNIAFFWALTWPSVTASALLWRTKIVSSMSNIVSLALNLFLAAVASACLVFSVVYMSLVRYICTDDNQFFPDGGKPLRLGLYTLILCSSVLQCMRLVHMRWYYSQGMVASHTGRVAKALNREAVKILTSCILPFCCGFSAWIPNLTTRIILANALPILHIGSVMILEVSIPSRDPNSSSAADSDNTEKESRVMATKAPGNLRSAGISTNVENYPGTLRTAAISNNAEI